ncbi:BZ3500_MvSof-1268-A1-R1_Chr1-1g01144 [Microbotryum saponariae]|uniref:BZ3500_MvSof-1268-A1-R1_Chr1-1g01144 protein n=1 Tax=Microbotryum saponariae TaxID=289078 RepID=A0A2X0K8H5_9BASI|nr:BZ3500_MvSof-1268-A1-R1_Chr1-1g01144 [Microbotryum saponariae]SCZ93498.1 BZ3501_MvSof-1269-A2-R1_Chr1-1g00741 [Microbotryum saponariae]
MRSVQDIYERQPSCRFPAPRQTAIDAPLERRGIVLEDKALVRTVSPVMVYLLTGFPTYESFKASPFEPFDHPLHTQATTHQILITGIQQNPDRATNKFVSTSNFCPQPKARRNLRDLLIQQFGQQSD